MSDNIFQYVHLVITGLTAVTVAYLSYKATVKKKNEIDHAKCVEGHHKLETQMDLLETNINLMETRIAVISERLTNEIARTGKSLDRVASKIDQIVEKL